MLRSKYARAKLLAVNVPELPDGYFYVDRNDVPGDNNVNIVMDDTPVYARETVEYIGEPIGMVCGPDEAVCEDILSRITVEYEELEPMLDLRKADEVFFNYEYEKGDIDKAFAEADKIYEEEFETGYQDQTYLETQGMMQSPRRAVGCMSTARCSARTMSTARSCARSAAARRMCTFIRTSPAAASAARKRSRPSSAARWRSPQKSAANRALRL